MDIVKFSSTLSLLKSTVKQRSVTILNFTVTRNISSKHIRNFKKNFMHLFEPFYFGICTCIRITAKVSPAVARQDNFLGNSVARKIETTVTHGRLPPWIPKAIVRKVETWHIANDNARAIATCITEGFSPDLDATPTEQSANIQQYNSSCMVNWKLKFFEEMRPCLKQMS